MKPFSLYIHIPFCTHKCPYCDFNTYAVPAFPEERYVEALLAELDFSSVNSYWEGRPLQSIFFGGGTPSLLSSPSVKRLIATILDRFPILPTLEVTVEANPGTLTRELLEGYRHAGINRISIGAQSFQPPLLKALGRIHSPTDVQQAVTAAREADFSNISIDLIYGIPGQTLLQLNDDLASALQLNLEHISQYCLTIEKGTPFGQAFERGDLVLPDEDLIVAMMETIETRLPEHGLNRYEISNYALKGYESRHNLAYWEGSDYLGLGAGAHSFFHSPKGIEGGEHWGERWCNRATPKEYMTHASSHGSARAWQDRLSPRALMAEFFFLGLRKINGVSIATFKELFDISAKEAFSTELEELATRQLILYEGESTLKLSPLGLRFADTVAGYFVLHEEVKS